MPANENPPEFTVTSVVMGILLAILAVLGVTDVLDLSAVIDTGMIGSVLLLVMLVACVFRSARRAKSS